MKMMQLTPTVGPNVFVNPRWVVRVESLYRQEGDVTKVHLGSGDPLWVVQTPSEIAQWMEAHS